MVGVEFRFIVQIKYALRGLKSDDIRRGAPYAPWRHRIDVAASPVTWSAFRLLNRLFPIMGLCSCMTSPGLIRLAEPSAALFDRCSREAERHLQRPLQRRGRFPASFRKPGDVQARIQLRPATNLIRQPSLRRPARVRVLCRLRRRPPKGSLLTSDT